jgi:hypothetical protein
MSGWKHEYFSMDFVTEIWFQTIGSYAPRSITGFLIYFILRMVRAKRHKTDMYDYLLQCHLYA